MRALIPKFFVRGAALLLLPFASASGANVTYIDLLDTTQANATYNSSATNTIATATAVGGFRTLSMWSTNNDFNDETSRLRIMTNAVGGGPRLLLNSGNDATANFTVTWGGANGTAGLGGIDFRAGLTSTNFNLTNSTLNFSLRSADLTSPVTWTFTDTNNSIATYTTSFPVQLPPPAAATSFAISLASFTGANSIDWSAINFISLSGGGLPSLDLVLTGPFSVTAESIATGPVDADGDGVNDYRENADGTDPDNASSFNSLSRGLVAFYPFNGSANDESGNSNDILLGDAGLAKGRDGLPATAMEFPGTQSAPQTKNNIGISGNSAFSMSFWVELQNDPVWPHCVLSGLGGYISDPGRISHFYYKPYFEAANLFVDENGPGASVRSLPTSLSQRWTQLTYTYNPSNRTFAIYRNGILQTDNYIAYDSALHDLRDAPAFFGSQSSGTVVSFDDIRIYNRTLLSTEVSSLYQAEAGNLDSDGDGLTDAWELGFGRYQIIPDGLTWDQAKADAESRGGHLATFTTAQEWAFFKELPALQPYRSPDSSLSTQIWTGGYEVLQGTWTLRWVTGEPWNFSNFAPPEPSAAETTAITIHPFPTHPVWGTSDNVYWNDDYDWRPLPYALEFGYPTDPLDPDSDDDGFNDKVESDAGSDPNNASAVPGFADSDGDGVNNFRESADGTNPSDANSFNPLSKGLVAYYPFDGNTEDRSGFQNHATANGNTQYTGAGLDGGALRTIGDFSLFYSGGGWVQLPLFGADMNNSFSLSFWAKDEESGGDPVHQEAYISFGQLNSSLVEVGLSGINGNYVIWQNNPGDRIESTVTSNAIASDKSWKNFVLTYGADKLSLYRNGILIWSATGTKNIFPVQYAALGRHWWEYGNASSARMSCTYDNVRIYGRTLSSVEVEQLYLSEVSILYVDASATGAADGSNWQDAYTDLQAALAAAQPGSQIWVAKGTYKPSSTGDRNASFALKSAVSLYGGFAGTETSPQQRDITANPTTLSGDLSGNDSGEPSYGNGSRADNSIHVVLAVNLNFPAVLDGFTVQDGHANSRNLSDSVCMGGGLLVEHSKLTVRNCRFRDNFAVLSASIYDRGESDLTIDACVFIANRSEKFGTVCINSTFDVLNSAFVDNRTQNCPTGYMWGGALLISDPTGTVANTIFANNHAGESGGAVYNHGNTKFVNCTFYGNTADTLGSAIYDRSLEASVENCVFWSNVAGWDPTSQHGGLSVISTDGNYGPQNMKTGGPVKNSIVQGGYEAPGSSNIITGDPAFYSTISPLGADGLLGTSDDGLQFMGWSPALEAGDNSFVPADITADIAGAPRIVGTVDLGAYEGAKVLDPAGDEDGDGILNGAETNSGVYTSTSDTGTNPLKPDTDGDGLTDGVETNTGSFVSASNTGTNPLAADTNADGITDGEAVTWNFNPLLNQTPFLEFLRFAVGQSGGRFGVFTQGQHDANRTNGRTDVTGNPANYNLFTQAQYDANRATGRLDVTSNPMSYGLYTSNSIMDLRMGGLMIQRQGTNAVISFQPQTTTDLTLPFTNNGTPINHQIPMPGNKGFIRIRANP